VGKASLKKILVEGRWKSALLLDKKKKLLKDISE